LITIRSRLILGKIKVSLEVQLPRRRTNVDLLGVLADDPVLALGLPVGDVTAKDISCECDGLVGLDRQAVEAAELNGRVLGATQAEVQLRDFVTGKRAVVGNARGDSKQNIP